VWHGLKRQLVVLIMGWAKSAARAKQTVGFIDYEIG
jgi:hypothetical protein